MNRAGVVAAQVGVALSGLVLAYGLASLVYVFVGPDCFMASSSVATLIELKSLAVVLALVTALARDVRALRAGGSAADWGRWGLGALSAGALVLGWAWAESFGDLLTCAEGD